MDEFGDLLSDEETPFGATQGGQPTPVSVAELEPHSAGTSGRQTRCLAHGHLTWFLLLHRHRDNCRFACFTLECHAVFHGAGAVRRSASVHLRGHHQRCTASSPARPNCRAGPPRRLRHDRRLGCIKTRANLPRPSGAAAVLRARQRCTSTTERSGRRTSRGLGSN